MRASEPESDRQEQLFRTIYVENCAWFRHIENERLSFTSFYAAIVAGVFAFVSRATLSKEQGVVLFLFLIFASAFGLAMSLRFRSDLDDFMARIRKMASDRGLEDYVGSGGRDWTTRIRMRELFPLFYLVTLALFVYMLALQLRG